MALPPATAEDAPARETADGYFSPLAPAKYVLLAIYKWGRTPVATPARVVGALLRLHRGQHLFNIAIQQLRIELELVRVPLCELLIRFDDTDDLDITALQGGTEETGNMPVH